MPRKAKGKIWKGLPHFPTTFFSSLFLYVVKRYAASPYALGRASENTCESITLQLVYLLGNENPSCSSSSEIQFVQAVLCPSGTGSSQVNKSFQTFCNWSLAHTENGVNIPRGWYNLAVAYESWRFVVSVTSISGRQAVLGKVVWSSMSFRFITSTLFLPSCLSSRSRSSPSLSETIRRVELLDVHFLKLIPAAENIFHTSFYMVAAVHISSSHSNTSST